LHLVVGLGNPGPEYETTRHNVGFRVVERLASRSGSALARDKRVHGRTARARIEGRDVLLLAPETWMNRSGLAVEAAIAAYPLDPASELLVVYDDLDLPFGRLRLRPSGGAGGHNGLADVIERLGRSDVARLRFGIGRPPPGGDAVAHVLAPFTEEEAASLGDHIERAADAIALVLRDGVQRAMNLVNAAPVEDPRP
jgi:PTH1 family peptidyl-tRNA hydrolase